MLFTKSNSPEAPKASLSHGQALKERCQHWINELTPEIPVLELFVMRGYYAFNPAKHAANQCERMRNIIDQIDNGEKHLQATNIPRLIDNTVLRKFKPDLEQVWKTGEPLFPDDLSKVSAFLDEQEREAEVKRIRESIARKARLQKELAEKAKAEQKQKRDRMAAELGISPDALEKMKGA